MAAVIISAITNFLFMVAGLVFAARPGLMAELEAKKGAQIGIFAAVIVLGLVGIAANVYVGISSENAIEATGANIQSLSSNVQALVSRTPAPVAPSRISWATKPVSSPNQATPYGLQATLQTTTTIDEPAVAIIYSGEISSVQFNIENASVEMGPRWWIANAYGGHANAAIVELQSPSFTPDDPLIVTAFSRSPVSVQRVMQLPPHFVPQPAPTGAQ